MVESRNPELIASALLSIAFWDTDWQWVEQQLLQFVSSTDRHVRYTSVLGFGHAARVNGNLNTNLVEPLLHGIAEHDPDAVIRETAEASLEDIDIYIHRPHREAIRLN